MDYKRKMTIRILSSVLALGVFVMSMPAKVFAEDGFPEVGYESNMVSKSADVAIWDGSIADLFAGGDGSIDNPYQIETANQLAKLTSDSFRDKCFILTRDIFLNDVSVEEWFTQNSVNVWRSIENFSGMFDGQRHYIYGLYGGSLFGKTTGIIQNIQIKDSFVSTGYDSYVGTIAGYAYKISGCSNNGQVWAQGNSTIIYAGGIAGYADVITQCYNEGAVYASGSNTAAAGGIVGCSGREITDCYNTGYVNAESSKGASGYAGGNSYAGGIAGSTFMNGTKIVNCYDSDMYAPDNYYYFYCGGIVGLTFNSYAPSLTNCYCSASRLVGRRASTAYGDYTAISCNTLTEDEMKQKSSYEGFDFETVWTLSDNVNEGFPILQWEISESDIQDPNSDMHNVIKLGKNSASLNEAFSVDNGSTDRMLLVLKSKEYTVDDLTIVSSDSSIIEIDSIEKDSGDYIVVDENEKIATIYLKAKNIGTANILVSAPNGIRGQVAVTSEEAIYSIKLYSYIPTLTIRKEGSIGAAVMLEKNGREIIENHSFAFVSSNSDVVTVTNVEDEKEGTFFTINGVNEGKAVVTVTEANTGAIYSISIQVNSGILTYNAEAMPKYYDNEFEYNAYIDGMYIDEFTISKPSGGMGGRNGIDVSFNVYNTTSVYGAVEVYDAEGNLKKTQSIKRFNNNYVTSIKDTVISGYKLIEDWLITGNILTYKQASYSECTPISVTVPYGGHIEISNNPTYSETCAIYNATNFITTSILMFGEVADFKKSDLKKLSEATADDLTSGFVDTLVGSLSGNTSSEKLGKLGEKFVEKITQKSMKKILESGIQGELASFIDDGKAILDECEIDADKMTETILSSAQSCGISMSESSLKKAMGYPGVYLSGIFTINNYLDYASFYQGICTPRSNKAVIIYFDNENGCLYDEGVSVKAENGSIDLSAANYVLHSVVLSNNIDLSEQMAESLNTVSNKYIVRNIYLEKDGSISQPNQTVQVTIPIPQEYNLNRCKLYWVQDDGKLIEVSAKIQNGNFVFTTDHFSYYAIAEITDELPVIAVDGICLDVDSLELVEGESKSLTVTITPDEATNRTILWNSNDEDVVIVTDGIITAIKEGTAIITAISQDSEKTASCTVNVTCAHNLSETEAVAATCEQDGNIAYYTCNKCGRTYEDALGIKEVTDVVVKAIGHKAADDWQSDANRHWKICANTDCGEIIENTKGDHTGGTATCSAKALCTGCGKTYGSINTDNHVNTEVRNAVAVTEENEGYTGDIWCLDCNTKIAEGMAIEKLNHSHAMMHHVAVNATCVSEGNVEYWTCSNSKCAGIYYANQDGTQILTIINTQKNSNNHVGGTKTQNAKEATTEQAGYSGDKVCISCGAIIETGKIIPALGKDESNDTLIPGQADSVQNNKGTGAKQDEAEVKNEPIYYIVGNCETHSIRSQS